MVAWIGAGAMPRQCSSPSDREVLRVLSDLYAAGLGETGWPAGLRSLAALFGAAGAVQFDLDRRAGRILAIETQGVEQGQGDYVARMNAINPRVKYALARPGCHTSCDYESLPEAAIRRHEFYAWLTRACGTKYFIGSRMIDAGEVSAFVSVEFAAEHGHPRAEEVELFARLTPHIANARRITKVMARAAALNALSEMLREAIPWAVFGLDGKGRVIAANRRATALAGRGDGLAIEKGRLKALRAAEDRTLQLILAHSLRTAQATGTYPGGALAIPRRTGRVAYALRAFPTGIAAGARAEAVPRVLVMVHDPDGQGRTRPEDLRAFFGLTEREGELALLVTDGLSLYDAADRLAIARNTARVHMASILRKTGVHSQAALVRLIGSLPTGGLD